MPRVFSYILISMVAVYLIEYLKLINPIIEGPRSLLSLVRLGAARQESLDVLFDFLIFYSQDAVVNII